MTDDMMNLQALVGKTADSDFLREMIGFAAQRLMSLEVGGLTGACYGEKSDDRLAQRNGYRERDWETRAAPSSCASLGSGRAATSPAFSSPDALPRKR
jgi:putative transposase